MARMKNMYREQVAPALMKQFAYSSVMQIPKLDKIVINIGAGDAKENSKVIENIITDLTTISGQKAVATVAKKSVANFKLRQGMKIGAKVTLRGDRMYEFVDRLFNFARPRVRDFKGINPNAFSVPVTSCTRWQVSPMTRLRRSSALRETPATARCVISVFPMSRPT